MFAVTWNKAIMKNLKVCGVFKAQNQLACVPTVSLLPALQIGNGLAPLPEQAPWDQLGKARTARSEGKKCQGKVSD